MFNCFKSHLNQENELIPVQFFTRVAILFSTSKITKVTVAPEGMRLNRPDLVSKDRERTGRDILYLTSLCCCTWQHEQLPKKLKWKPKPRVVNSAQQAQPVRFSDMWVVSRQQSRVCSSFTDWGCNHYVGRFHCCDGKFQCINYSWRIPLENRTNGQESKSKVWCGWAGCPLT